MDLLKSFQVFQQVAELQSFSRAAETLGLVPSAVSRQIRELEKWVGVRLIHRTTRSLQLTEEGRLYLEKMSIISHQVAELQVLHTDSQYVKGHIRLTAPMMIGQYVLPESLSRFKKAHPQIEISISLMNRMADLVEEGFDLAVRVGRLADSNMIARSIGHMNLKTVASADYLQRMGVPTQPKQLTRHNCLINSGISVPRRWSYEVNGKATSVKIEGDLVANESLCLKAFAIAGQGIAQLPTFYVEKELATGELVEILSDCAPPPLPINVVYHSQRLISPAVRALVEFLVEDLRPVA